MDTKLLASALKEVAQFERGELALKTTEVFPPMVDVKKLRSDIGVTQREFADRFGFSSAAIRNWEQGVREPEGPARVLLALIKRNPQLIESELKKLRSATGPLLS